MQGVLAAKTLHTSNHARHVSTLPLGTLTKYFSPGTARSWDDSGGGTRISKKEPDSVMSEMCDARRACKWLRCGARSLARWLPLRFACEKHMVPRSRTPPPLPCQLHELCTVICTPPCGSVPPCLAMLRYIAHSPTMPATATVPGCLTACLPVRHPRHRAPPSPRPLSDPVRSEMYSVPYFCTAPEYIIISRPVCPVPLCHQNHLPAGDSRPGGTGGHGAHVPGWTWCLDVCPDRMSLDGLQNRGRLRGIWPSSVQQRGF